MAEIIDYLFFFWILVTIAVCVLGGIYERHLRAIKQQQHEPKQHSGELGRTDWSPRYSCDALTSSYNNYDSNRYSIADQQRPQSYSHRLSAAASGIDIDGAELSRKVIYPSSYSASPSSSSSAAAHGRSIYEPRGSRASASSGSNHYESYYDGSQSSSAALKLHRGGSYSHNSRPMQASLDFARDSHLTTRTRSPFDNSLGGRTADDGNSIPIAAGPNDDCVEWVNQILYLFYAQAQKYGPILADSISRSLNEKLSNITSSMTEYNNLLVDFTGLNFVLSSKPELTNIRTETESDKSVSSTCKIYNKRVVLDLVITRQTHDPLMNLRDDLLDNVTSQPQAHYELILENLEGKVKSVALLNDRLIVIQFIEKPNTKILLRPKNHRSSRPGARNLIINEDSLVKVIVTTLTQVVVDLYFGDDPDFPLYKHGHHFGSSLGQKFSQLKGHIKHDFLGALSLAPSSSTALDNHKNANNTTGKDKKVFVKILHAKNINYNQNVTCLMELDYPYQLAISTTKQGNSNPNWNEHFLFTINDHSSQLTLELWDSITVPANNNNNNTPRTKRFGGLLSGSQHQQQAGSGGNRSTWNKADLTAAAKFLGLAKVSIDELRRNPVQNLSLMLQSGYGGNTDYSGAIGGGQPADLLSNSVGGELVIELVFLEHLPSSTARSSLRRGLRKSNSVSSLICAQKGDIVSVDRKLTRAGYVITTTVITKPTQNAVPCSSGGSIERKRLRNDQLSAARNQSPTSINGADALDLLNTTGDSPAPSSGRRSQIDNRTRSSSTNQLNIDDGRLSDSDYRQQQQRSHRSRSRNGSRSFFRALRRRFSFSRTRSRSVGGESGGLPATVATGPATSGQRVGSKSPQLMTRASDINPETSSISSRSRASSVVSVGRTKSMPPTSAAASMRDSNEMPPTVVINKSRLSVGTANAALFTQPKSQLVIECEEFQVLPDGSIDERGLLKYYAIPHDAIDKGKWRRRGLKLHLVNEHQFVACHLTGSSTCHLCAKVFSRRPGKQGYRCRNCHLLSHKQCHVKVDHNCPYATRGGLKLEYVGGVSATTTERRRRSSELNSRNVSSVSLGRRQQATLRSMGTKSISMEVDNT